MKKLITLVMIAVVSFSSLQTQAQAFDKSTKQLSIGLGVADMWHFALWDKNVYTYYKSFAPITGQLSVQGEFAVHKYIGVGFNVGIGGRARSAYTLGLGLANTWGYPSEFNIPIGAIANFHFYQLIADKTGKGSKLHSDKLDIYAGVNLGSGIAIHPADNYYFYTTQISALLWAGPHVGVNYFFTEKIGVKGEIGYGKTLVNAAITFKL